MRRVALVTYHCPPVLNAESILVWKTLRRLSSQHAVTVFTSPIGRGGIDSAMAIPENVRVVREPDVQFSSRFLDRASNKAIGMLVDEKFPWSQLAELRVAHDEFDVIYSRSQPGASHILALRLKRLLNVPWVAQLSDPWASNPYHSSHTKFRSRVDAHYEARVVTECDRLIFPTVEIERLYERQYPSIDIRAKSVVLPHHTSTDLYTLQSAPISYSPNKLNLAYFGDFYGSRSPEPLIRAVNEICDKRPEVADKLLIHFVGNVESKFQPLVDSCRVPIRRGKVGYVESLNAMMNADILLLIDAPNPSGETPFFPSKLIDYLGARRPILGITELSGTAPNILRSYGYPVIRPEDVDGIREQLEAWMESPPTTSAKPIDDFLTDVVVDGLSDILEQA